MNRGQLWVQSNADSWMPTNWVRVTLLSDTYGFWYRIMLPDGSSRLQRVSAVLLLKLRVGSVVRESRSRIRW